MKRWFGNGLIVVGLGILATIGIGNYTHKAETARLMQQFEQLPFEQMLAAEESSVETAAVMSAEHMEGDVLAVLDIPKIELTVPVVEGTGVDQLRVAVGRMVESGKWGAAGDNVALAGHRSNTFGQFFNRLDEMETGDRFTVKTREATYTYMVTSKTIVNPTDVDVIHPVQDKTLVTLITCHPFNSSKQRLIIQAEWQEQQNSV